MNKKKLSVVMAGAMLATSVAPVLAETTTNDYSIDNIALLGKQIVDKMETKMISTNPALKLTSTGVNATGDTDGVFVEGEVADLMKVNASAYGVKIYDANNKVVDLNTINSSISASTEVTFSTAEVKGIFSSSNISKIKPGYKIEVVERATSEFYGEIIPGTSIIKGANTERYKPTEDFTDEAIKATETQGATHKEIVVKENGIGNVLVSGIANDGSVTDEDDKLTVTLNKEKDGQKVTLTLDKDSYKIDGRLPLTSDGKLLDFSKMEDVSLFDHFDTLSDWTLSKEITKAPEVKESYKLTSTDTNENTFKASDLYDGVLLTSKGTEIAAELKNAKENASAKGKELVKITANDNGIDSSSPISTIKIAYYKNETEAAKDDNNEANGMIDSSESINNAYKVITIYSSNSAEMRSLHAMLTDGSYKVGILGGANRYETAVNVAKQQGIDKTTYSTGGNIVLVNGESLVDGLAAAPLAAKLTNTPVLLSKSDSLPKETKAYIDSLVVGLTSAQKKKITINLVGGESVLSNKLVSELEGMGFYVKRLGGKDREATSLKVAEEIVASGNSNAAFVVGGNGESDAMAISAVATQKESPIIVSSVHGLSNNALSYLNEKSAKGDVTIVGGTSVVSESEEKAINNALVLNKANRIAGDTRFDTNANIIKEYYKKLGTTSGNELTNLGASAIFVVKDGVNNKSELVDALSAANYAAVNNAPIVLASKELKASQKHALLEVDIVKGNGSSTETSLKKAIQIGNGGDRNVLLSVAKIFGLSNTK